MNNKATHYNLKNVLDAEIVGVKTGKELKESVLDFLVAKQNIEAAQSIITETDCGN